MRAFVTSSLAALALLIPAAAAPADFVDTFDGTSIDTSKWDTTHAVTGMRWCADDANTHFDGTGHWFDSATEQCWGQAAQPPIGTVGVADGALSLRGDADWVAPFFYSAGNPFPAEDFRLTTRLKFGPAPFLNGNGTWFSATRWEPTFEPDTAYGEDPILRIVGDTTRSHVRLLGRDDLDWLIPVPSEWHTYRLEWVDGEYSFYFDDLPNPVIGPLPGPPPTRLFFGNAVFTHWGPGTWTELDVDEVRVEGLGGPAPPDGDNDGVPDASDNCPSVSNPGQEDTYGDARGDACEPPPPPPDVDGDGVPDANDNCISAPNADQADADGDGQGDACDAQPYGPADEQLEDLIEIVEQLEAGGAGGGISSKLENALKAIEDDKIGTACNVLNAAINAVNAQRGKKISSSEADQLILAIERVRTELGC